MLLIAYILRFSMCHYPIINTSFKDMAIQYQLKSQNLNKKDEKITKTT